jgi:hypothetical protein
MPDVSLRKLWERAKGAMHSLVPAHGARAVTVSHEITNAPIRRHDLCAQCREKFFGRRRRKTT